MYRLSFCVLHNRNLINWRCQCCHFNIFETISGLFCNRLVYFFWFIVYVVSLFFIFWLVFSFLKVVLRQVSAVFPALICVWFRRFKENPSKHLDTRLFLTTVCSNISLYQQEPVRYNP